MFSLADFISRVGYTLEMMLLNREPEEIFASEDRRDWEDWLEFFSRTRETDGRRKGIVEIEL